MGPGSTIRFLDLFVKTFHRSLGSILNSEFPRIVVCTIPESDHMGGHAKQETIDNLFFAWELLARAKVDFVVAPCNTAHQFLRSRSGPVRVLDIAGAVGELASCELAERRVLFLSTRQTKIAGLYDPLLARSGATPVIVSEADQVMLDQIILHVNAGESSEFASDSLSRMISSYEADVVLLACTELSLVQLNGAMPIVGSLELLVEAAFRVASQADDLSRYDLL